MKILQFPQGSPQWHAARLGIPTASRFGSIVTPSGKPSSAADAYMHALLAERLLGVPLDSESVDFMERGKALEDEAIRWYEMQHDCDVQRVGFVQGAGERYGCSPDGLVGEDGGVELKCPSPAIHVGYMLDTVAAKYLPQVQGALWITGRKWWDLISYHPDLPVACVRVERDAEFIDTLSEAVTEFCNRLDEAEGRLRAGMAAGVREGVRQ